MGDKKNPALIELIIVIFFFSLSAAIIAQLFVTSYQISRKSQKDSTAVIQAQDMIEQLKADPMQPEIVLGNWENTNDQNCRIFTAYLDGQMNSTLKDQCEYIFVIQIENLEKNNGTLVKIQVSVYDKTADNRTIIQLDASRYISSIKEDTL